VRRQPTPRSKHARVLTRLRTARSTPTCAAARPRDSSIRSSGAGADGAARARVRGDVSPLGGAADGREGAHVACGGSRRRARRARESQRGGGRRARRRRERRRGRALRRLDLQARVRMEMRGLECEVEVTLAAGGAACGREERSRGVRRQPTPRSENARVSVRLTAARSTATCAAARPRASSTRSAGSCAGGAARARVRGEVSPQEGGWRARGALARRAAATDAALGKHESTGAADSSALDSDARGGEAARFVD
jgi:hypothetical protein